MLTTASIRNFKGISKCDINDFGRINLFVGRNDVGKSTILESICYTLKEFTSPHLLDIIGRRTNAFFEARELWYGYWTKNRISVNLTFGNNATAKLKVSYIPHPPLDFDVECRGTIESETLASTRTTSTYKYIKHKLKPPASHTSNLSDNLSKDMLAYISNCSFLDSSNRNDILSTENLFDSIKRSKKTAQFNRYLRSVFDKESGVQIMRAPAQLGSVERNRLALTRRKGSLRRTVFLSGLGDGIRYGIQIIGTGLISANTCLFIEEIESNQHPASLKRLIDFMAEIAFENNLQLFVTTHSKGAVMDLRWHFRKTDFKDDPRLSDVKCFLVERDSSSGEVVCSPKDVFYSSDYAAIVSALFG